METVMILCAHPDDEVFGVGGTIAKYAKEGKRVVTVIFTYGEKALPILKPEEARKVREKESLTAAEKLGVAKTYFLGLKEGNIGHAPVDKKLELKKIIEEENPQKIFTHSLIDTHFDHRALHHMVIKLLKEMEFKGAVYTFDIWNPLITHNKNDPKLYVDISQEFKLKWEASKIFQSQGIAGRWPLMPAFTFRALLAGFQHKCRFAERFTKVNV